MSANPPIPPTVLEQAADWLTQLNASTATEADRQACERWRQADPEHARAWARAELLLNKLGNLPSGLAMPALDRPRGAGRRAAMAKLAGLLAAVPAGWMGWRLAQRQGWTADHRTAVGERRSLRLADGSTVMLNTSTSIDILFDAAQRTIVLRAGEILVQTAKDTMAAGRPFRVRTAEGDVEALGTRFSVREREGQTEVAVFEKAVRIEPRRMPASGYLTLEAGLAACFTDGRIGASKSLAAGAEAWTGGMLMVDRMRLADFAAELERYRGGIVRCDAAVANVLISGTFPVDDPDRVLAMLIATYPVAAHARLHGYWVTFGPA